MTTILSSKNLIKMHQHETLAKMREWPPGGASARRPMSRFQSQDGSQRSHRPQGGASRLLPAPNSRLWQEERVFNKNNAQLNMWINLLRSAVVRVGVDLDSVRFLRKKFKNKLMSDSTELMMAVEMWFNEIQFFHHHHFLLPKDNYESSCSSESFERAKAQRF